MKIEYAPRAIRDLAQIARTTELSPTQKLRPPSANA
jgi:hypothetical protein